MQHLLTVLFFLLRKQYAKSHEILLQLSKNYIQNAQNKLLTLKRIFTTINPHIGNLTTVYNSAWNRRIWNLQRRHKLNEEDIGVFESMHSKTVPIDQQSFSELPNAYDLIIFAGVVIFDQKVSFCRGFYKVTSHAISISLCCFL